MPEAVEDRFPDVPEKCLLCPGIVTAAENAAARKTSAELLGRTSMEAQVPLQRSGEARFVAVAQVLGVHTTEVARTHHRSVDAFVWLLCGGCEQGVTVGYEFRPPKRFKCLLPRLRGRIVVTQKCGSTSPIADLIPKTSTEADMLSETGVGNTTVHD